MLNWGYAVTDHVAQGRTVTGGRAVIAGTEDRQHAYVALSCGTDTNMAYVFTVSPKLADPMPGPRPAPELARYDRITAERTVQQAAVATETQHALAVLSGVLDRNGQQLSASQARQQALADADHLAILHAIWTDQTIQAREQHYRDLLAAHLPPGHRREPGYQARWLWRTLRAAELAGLDPGDVLAAAISERDLVGARDLAAVIDARIRYRTGALVPAPTGPWSFQVPAIADATRHAYLTEITALMDACQDRIGEHAARHALPRAVTALGPVPDDPQNRAEWQKRAASIGAWRELSGHRDPADPIRLPRPRRSCLLVVDTLVTQRRRGGFARRRSHTGTRPGSQGTADKGWGPGRDRSRSAGRSCRPLPYLRDQALLFPTAEPASAFAGSVNDARNSGDADRKQRDRRSRSARLERIELMALFQYIAAATCAGGHGDSTTHRDRHQGRCVDARASAMPCHAAWSAGESS